MAFTSTVDDNGVPNIIGNKKMTSGTYTSAGGSTGGNIDTGLKYCDNLILQPKGSSVATNAPVVNESLPGVAGSAITIVTDANEVGRWVAFGR